MARNRTILAIIATDTTFERATVRGREVWAGRCLHCGSHLLVGLDGTPISRATVEHILPRHHGGTDDLENLGLACARCNHGKGARHDRRHRDDPRLREIVDRLAARRRERWRDPQQETR